MSKHILIVSRTTPMHILGGMEMVAWDTAVELARLGMKVTYLTTTILEYPEIFEKDGISVHSIQGITPGKYSRQWWTKSEEIYNQKYYGKIDAVLSISTGAYGLLKSKGNIPFFIQVHGTAMQEFKTKWKTGRLKDKLTSAKNLYWLIKDLKNYSLFDRVIPVGDAVYGSFHTSPYLRRIKNGDYKLFFIRNGIDTNLFKPDLETRKLIRSDLNINSDEKLIITTSKLIKQKGVEFSVLGFAHYAKKYKNAKYLILGDGEEKSKITSIIRDQNIEDRVILFGKAERSEVAKYLQAADLFIFTTLRDEAGITLNVLEALAVGLPVIVSDHLKGIDAISPDFIYNVNPRDPHSIFKRIEEFTQTTKGNQGSLLPEQYTLNYNIKQYQSLFNMDTPIRKKL